MTTDRHVAISLDGYLDGVADPGLELLSLSSSPPATHLRYRVGR